jgi:DNA modification methylase
MRRWKEQGIKAQTCVTSPPYYGLRDYGHEGQIGLEETPEEYIKAMVEVFRCVWDVLEDDGTLWLNIGDSYASMQRSGKKESPGVGAKQEMLPIKNKIKWGKGGSTNFWWRIPTEHHGDIKPKDLIGIPWLLAFALRADGWYLRQDIIWHKPNPMPESVQDRCTKAHEYIFLMSKSQKYYYDGEAIKEESINTAEEQESKRNKVQHRNNAAENEAKFVQHNFSKIDKTYEKRNKRSVWTVTTKPYAGAHFATFPSDLIEPCIMAGAPTGGIVLDPFMGSGTTAQVAQSLGRQYLGCELNLDYKKLQEKRLAQQSLVLE